MEDLDFRDVALRMAPLAATVANFCDHVEHNETAPREWVTDAGAQLRDLAVSVALGAAREPVKLYAERLGEIEARNVLVHPDAFDGHQAALEARTWRELQLVQAEHDRFYHPDVSGLTKSEQLRHYALHLAKIVGAFAEPRDGHELLHRRLPDMLLFGIKLATSMAVRLGDDPLPRTAATIEIAAPR